MTHRRSTATLLSRFVWLMLALLPEPLAVRSMAYSTETGSVALA